MRGLYAITAAGGDTALRVRDVECAIAGGARFVQYRDKGGDEQRRLREVTALRALCHQRSVPLIVNDDLALAVAGNADGVHLGRNDVDVATARAALPAGALIGVSCYNELERARAAQRSGADYVAFGSCFPSSTKPGAVRASIDLLRQARAELQLPIVAIGGITPENGRALIDAGVDMLAVIQGLFGQPDIEAAARDYQRLFAETEIDRA